MSGRNILHQNDNENDFPDSENSFRSYDQTFLS